MNTHLCERTGRKQPPAAVCGEPRPLPKVSAIGDLFASEAPCQRCLEWVVEQGQIATRRLEDMRGEGASQ